MIEQSCYKYIKVSGDIMISYEHFTRSPLVLLHSHAKKNTFQGDPSQRLHGPTTPMNQSAIQGLFLTHAPISTSPP